MVRLFFSALDEARLSCPAGKVGQCRVYNLPLRSRQTRFSLQTLHQHYRMPIQLPKIYRFRTSYFSQLQIRNMVRGHRLDDGSLSSSFMGVNRRSRLFFTSASLSD